MRQSASIHAPAAAEASPSHRRIAGPQPLPIHLAEKGNKENNPSQDRHNILDCPTLCEYKGRGATSKKRKAKPAAGGFNLRKSIAWNPAFFTEQGVLDNTELSMLSGSSQLKSPASGCSSSTFSPLSRFGKSGNTSVLKEVGENSRGKFPAKYLSTENKGRKLFASSIASGQDERKAPVKKVPNSSAAAQILRIPKKSQPSLPVVSRTRSTSSVTNVPKPTTKPATVKSKHIHKVEGPLLKSKTEKPSVTKSSQPTIGKDMVPTLNATCGEANGSGKCRTSSPVSQDNPSSSVVVPSPISTKPSALRMPSPSLGFFAQGKAYVSHSDSAKINPERCFSGNIPSLVKPPRYKQPLDLKSRFHLSKQLPTNVSDASNLHVQSVNNDSTTKVSVSSFPGLLDANDCSEKQSLSKSSIPFSSIESVEDSCFLKVIPSSSESTIGSKLTASFKLDSNDSNIDGEMELMDDALAAKEAPRLHEGAEWDHDCRSTECSPMNLPSPCVDQEAQSASLIEKTDTADGIIKSHHSLTEEIRPVLSEEQDTEDRIEFDTNKLSSSEGVSNIGTNNSVHKSRTNTISKDHLKNLVPFTEEWLAVVEAFGEEVLEKKSGAVQNSPTDKTAPEPSPWSPVKRKAQDVGPFACTKYSKTVLSSNTP
uniref:Uncharacterized protein n=1 Tax=Leersia perrieri TaxID=77586 RepID=A0A0D9XXB4_9ORYZ